MSALGHQQLICCQLRCLTVNNLHPLTLVQCHRCAQEPCIVRLQPSRPTRGRRQTRGQSLEEEVDLASVRWSNSVSEGGAVTLVLDQTVKHLGISQLLLHSLLAGISQRLLDFSSY